jgi:hypothetical protein
MERKSGQEAQKQVWTETRDELEKKVPEVQDVYKLLGDR